MSGLDASAFGYVTWKVELDGHRFVLSTWDAFNWHHGLHEEMSLEKILTDNCPESVCTKVQNAITLFNSIEGNYAHLSAKEFFNKTTGAHEVEAGTGYP